MKNRTLSRCLLTALALSCVPIAFAQTGLPTTQPKRLTIIREKVKPGANAAHARHEAGWPAAFAKANSPDYYLALTSMTGPNEAWFLIPSESFAAEAASMKRFENNAELSAELDRLSREDAEHITDLTTLQANGRPDLSLGKFPDIGKARFFEVSMFTVRIGQEDKMEKLLKTYAKVRQRVSPEASYRFYTVQAGMAGSVYIAMQSVADYGEFDRINTEHQKVFEVATPEEQADFAKWAEAVSRAETNYFRLDPKMSYVGKDTKAADPEFWGK